MAWKLKFANTGLLCLVSAGLSGIAGCQSSEVHAVDPGHVTESRNLTIRDFNDASSDLTNKMLSAPRMQDELTRITSDLQKTGEAKRPLIKISRIRNDTGLNVNMVDYVVAPIEETLTNNGKLDFFSEDKTRQDIAAGQEILGRPRARLADLTLTGVVSRLRNSDDGVQTNAYVFQFRVVDTASNTVVFVGSRTIGKLSTRGGMEFSPGPKSVPDPVEIK